MIQNEEINEHLSASSTPEWMVKMDDDLNSTIGEYEAYCELFGWSGQSHRFTKGDLANRLFTSASLKHSGLIIVIPNGDYAVKIENKMNSGIKYDSVELVRLGHVEGQRVKLQEIKFGICRIKSFSQELDQIVVEMIVTSKENTVFVFDNTGTNTGQSVSKVDYSKNSLE